MGGTASDDFPAEAAALPDVATFDGVNMEQLVASDPDLVLAAGNGLNKPADIARIRELGIPVIVLYPEDVPGVLDDIQLIGDAIGKSDEAEAMTSAMQARIDDISAAAAAVPQPRTFYELGADPELYGPTDDSFVADMITLAGGEPITTGSTTVSSLSLERLVDQDPEVIVLGDANYGTTVDQVVARPGWNVMSAVKSGAIRPVDDIVVTRPGPRLADGLAALALAIHPDLDPAQPGAVIRGRRASDATDRGNMSAGTATDARPALRVGRLEAVRHRPVAVGLGALAALAVAIVAGVAFGNIAVPDR